MLRKFEDLEPYLEEYEFEDLMHLVANNKVPRKKNAPWECRTPADFINANIWYGFFNEGKTQIDWREVYHRLAKQNT